MITKQDRIKWGTMGAISKWSKLPPKEERFWSKISIGPIDQCWPWKQKLQRTGYGRVRYEGVQDMAHRVAYRLHYKSFDPSLWVLHHCDNRQCCNPHHLFQGTPADNVADMVAKGRQSGPKTYRNYPRVFGERCGKAKLREVDIKDIIGLWSSRRYTQIEIAKRFSVGQDQISRIVNGKRWKHITRQDR